LEIKILREIIYFMRFKYKYYNLFVFFLLFSTMLFSQNNYNSNFIKKLNSNKSIHHSNDSSKHSIFSISFNQSFYFNTNLPNLENFDGLYIPKGYGLYSSIFYLFNSKYVELSAEPTVKHSKEYKLSIPEKLYEFSVLNDVPKNNQIKYTTFKNSGIKLKKNNLSLGVGNWNHWWGPGIHNSLVLSNNSEGFYHYYIGIDSYESLIENIKYKFKYMVSEKINYYEGSDYYFSAWFLELKYKMIQIGIARNVISGGYPDLKWDITNAATVLLDNNNIIYWDTINSYYISSHFDNNLMLFIELAFPKRNFGEKDINTYWDHSMASNLGLRKQGAFGSDYFTFGFEYTRLVQGIYYNNLPTANWYDNKRNHYSSFNSRRWAAHSGSDSDDFLIFLGYVNNIFSMIYSVNFERHGITYSFPPEVKFENRISASFNLQRTSFYLHYEYEYFEHYGFVDNNKNVWNETFEEGSRQFTHTLLFSVEHLLKF
jgi:hypothetical protein